MKQNFFIIRPIMIIALCAGLFISASAVTVKTSAFRLLGSDGYLDWKNGGSVYSVEWKNGTNIWNNYKPGVIRAVSSNPDVTIYDNSDAVNNYHAYTFPVGLIEFYPRNMEQLTSTQKKMVAAHECGHALGLAHNTSNDVMYEYAPRVTSLSANDKASYDKSYSNATGKSSSGSMLNKAGKTYYGCPSYCINVDCLEDVVGYADYVFVATVKSNDGTEYRNIINLKTENGESFWGSPYTNYTVSMVENIKGCIYESEFQISQFGGLDQSGDFYIWPEGDDALTPGATYVFVAYTQPDGSLLLCGKNSNVEIETSENSIAGQSIEGQLYNDAEVYNKFYNAYLNQSEFDRVRYTATFAE